MFYKDITEVTVEEFDRLFAVNVRGMFLACKHAIPPMLEQRSGSIVIISSGSAFRGQEFDGVSTFAYNMTKAAVRQLAISLATRYARDGIRVNAVAPGVTRTNQLRHFIPGLTDDHQEAMFKGAAEATTPLGRYGDPQEIATRNTLPGIRRRFIRHRNDACRRWRLFGTIGKDQYEKDCSGRSGTGWPLGGSRSQSSGLRSDPVFRQVSGRFSDAFETDRCRGAFRKRDRIRA